jgi:predicted P-loop ATPase
MPIIEGKQGIGKTTILRVIGGKWYKSISLTEQDKDTIQKMQGAWIIEVAELAAFSKRDIDSLKAFVTVCVDSSRFAYARNDKKYPRQSVFVGTINPEDNGYLLDKTGNRRFLPVLVNNIDIKSIEKHRDQLFAEAVELYRSGVKIYIEDKMLNEKAEQEQSKREEQDDWAEIILNWVNAHRMDISTKMTTCDVYIRAIGGKPEQYDQRIARRIGNILRRLNCGKSELAKINGVVGKFYDLSSLLKVQDEQNAWTE